MQQQWKDAYPGITGKLLSWGTQAFGRDVKQGSYSALWALTASKIEEENLNGWVSTSSVLYSYLPQFLRDNYWKDK